MPGNSHPLPEFSQPPVIEVALSVQFEPLPSMNVAHFGLFWTRIRQEFPKTQYQPPLPATVERFGGRVPQPTLTTTIGYPMPRCWFLNQEETELLQLQTDRLIHNWRKLEGQTAPYPRYHRLRDKLLSEYSILNEFVEQEHLGQLVPNQCELTYINHISFQPMAANPPDLTKVIAPWRQQYSDSFLSAPESVNASLTFVIPGPTGAAGRLYLVASPSLRVTDDQPLLVLQVICRGAPDGNGIDGLFRFLDNAHEWAVRAFASFTTTEMHSRWGRTS